MYFPELIQRLVLLLFFKLYEFSHTLYLRRFLAKVVATFTKTHKNARTLHALRKAADKIRRAFLIVFLDLDIRCHSAEESTI